MQNTYNFSDGFVRNFHYASLNGKLSKAYLNGCFFLKDKNLCTNKTHITHNAPDCESNQTYKGLLSDFAKANYFSNTYVSKESQGTEGYQLSKGILLSDNCSFFSKPELKIYTDDVKCSHGSTIGPVDESAIYYLRSRGISEDKAKNMLIFAFLNEVFDEIKDDDIREKIKSYVERKLDI